MLKNYELLFFLSLVDSVLKYFIKGFLEYVERGPDSECCI